MRCKTASAPGIFSNQVRRMKKGDSIASLLNALFSCCCPISSYLFDFTYSSSLICFSKEDGRWTFLSDMAGNGTAVIFKSQSKRSAYLSVCVCMCRERERGRGGVRKGRGWEVQWEAGREHVLGREGGGRRGREKETHSGRTSSPSHSAAFSASIAEERPA